ncbi:MAG TPA: hypothetical protein VIV11_05730 [Kofleriaceae bacterium]
MLRRRTITPEILRAAIALTNVVPSSPRSLLCVILDAIEVGYAKVDFATHRRLTSS